jgi:hypothetical protein
MIRDNDSGPGYRGFPAGTYGKVVVSVVKTLENGRMITALLFPPSCHIPEFFRRIRPVCFRMESKNSLEKIFFYRLKVRSMFYKNDSTSVSFRDILSQ